MWYVLNDIVPVIWPMQFLLLLHVRHKKKVTMLM
jgi:hypothetical protein